DLVAQRAIGEILDAPGHRTVPDQRDALTPSRRNMTVDRVPAHIEPGAGKPSDKGRPARIENPIPALLPIDRLGSLRPEFLRPLQRAAVRLGIAGHRLSPKSALSNDTACARAL